MATKTLHDYILGARKDTVVRIKFANIVIDDAVLDRLEKYFGKYELVKMGKPVKTIFQPAALGFEKPTMGEIFMVDATVAMPVSTYVMRLEICHMFRISETQMVVDRVSGPDHLDKKDEKEEYKVKISTDPEYPEDKNLPPHSETYGNEHTEVVVKTLADARKEVRNEITKTAGKDEK